LILINSLVETQDPEDRLIKTFLLLSLNGLKDDGGVDLLHLLLEHLRGGEVVVNERLKLNFVVERGIEGFEVPLEVLLAAVVLRVVEQFCEVVPLQILRVLHLLLGALFLAVVVLAAVELLDVEVDLVDLDVVCGVVGIHLFKI
jgi:hypothetical protein